jgi:hypothetical protein
MLLRHASLHLSFFDLRWSYRKTTAANLCLLETAVSASRLPCANGSGKRSPNSQARFESTQWADALQKELSPSHTGRSNKMPLIQVLEVLIVVGVLLWLVNRFIPMQSSIKSILNGVVVIAVVLWLLNIFGLFHSISNIRVGRG